MKYAAATTCAIAVTLASAAAANVPRFVCAGAVAPTDAGASAGAAAKAVAYRTEGTRGAIAIFATFADGDPAQGMPSWAGDLFNPELPGSFSHFYDTMSFGRLRVRGEATARRYRSSHGPEHYLSADPRKPGNYAAFSLDVLTQADARIDFSEFDNDGPDGKPASGDDDGVVDALFLIVDRAPHGFLRGPATGIASLGLEGAYVTEDRGPGGAIVVSPRQGMIQQGRSLSEAVGAMCHEFGHILGLPDLYDVEFLGKPGAGPWEDSAGIGAWGLMGWGALGWNGNDGPNSFSAWSRMRLGWAEVQEAAAKEEAFELKDVGLAGQVYRIPLNSRGHFLLEHRRRTSSHYDRAVPAEGLLVWHVERDAVSGRWTVDLESADGLWDDAGYPLGTQANPHTGEDNLDFWAHDPDYATRHGGNRGDHTDPFDGVAYTDFTPDTNPAATSLDGEQRIHLQEITIVGGRASGRVRLGPLAVALHSVSTRSARIPAGNAEAILFEVENTGARVAEGLRAVLRADDPLLEILEPELALRPLDPGQRAKGGYIGGRWGFPQVRFPPRLNEQRTATVEVVVYADDLLLARGHCKVTGVPANVVTGAVLDPDGDPVAGILVNVTGPNHEATAKSTTNGLVTFGLPAGTYTFTVHLPDVRWGTVRLEEIAVAADTSLVFRVPPTHLLHGVIRHGDGAPASGWRVNVSRGGRHVAGETSTDGSYALRLPPGEYVLKTYGRADGQAGEHQTRGAIALTGDAELDILLDGGVEPLQGGVEVLSQAVELTLRVLDEGGTAVDGALLRVGPAFGDLLPEQLLTIRAGGEARTHVLPGALEIDFPALPAQYVHPDPLRTYVPTDTTVTIVLRHSATLRGRLFSEDGEPVTADLDLTSKGRRYSTTSQPVLGQYGPIYVPAGSYRCAVSPASESGLPSQHLGVLEIRGDTSVDFTVRRGVTVHGQIHGAASGSGLAGLVRARTLDGLTSNLAPTDGHFDMALIPGQYWFGYTSSTSPSQTLGIAHVTRDTVLAWRLLEGEAVKGRVVDASGSGVADLWVQAVGSASGRQVSDHATTDAYGAFALRLPPGSYRMRAHAGGAMISRGLIVPLAEAVTFRLPGGATLVVTDPSGNPTGAWLSLQERAFDLAEHLKGVAAAEAFVGDGQAVEVDPGLYAAVVSEPGSGGYGRGPPNGLPAYERVIEDLLVEGDTELAVSMPLSGGRFSVAGTVSHVDSAGPPLSQPLQYGGSSMVSFYEEEQGLLVHAELVDGRFGVHLPTGVYEAAVRVGSWHGAAVREVGSITVARDRRWDIDLARPTAVEEPATTTPQRFVLEQNYPNPFNGDTSIRFTVAAAGDVELTVYDLLGQRVRRLVGEPTPRGRHTVRWDGRDDAGWPVASGVYVYRLQAVSGQVAARKLLVLR